MFREMDKLNTSISALWFRSAVLVSYLSTVTTLALGGVYFGAYFFFIITISLVFFLILVHSCVHVVDRFTTPKCKATTWVCIYRRRKVSSFILWSTIYVVIHTSMKNKNWKLDKMEHVIQKLCFSFSFNWRKNMWVLSFSNLVFLNYFHYNGSTS